ncbi:MAG: lanthionine synthetase LanC family protein, partial [Candidatus Nanopelagicales bacterium]
PEHGGPRPALPLAARALRAVPRTSADYRGLGESAWRWTLDQLRDDDGPWLPEWVRPEESEPPSDERDILYCGIAGLVPALAEVGLQRPLDEREELLRSAVRERLSGEVLEVPDFSLYVGAAGYAYALALLGGDPAPALDRIASSVGEHGWPHEEFAYVNDVIGGSAGIVMTGSLLGGAAGRYVVEAGAARLLGTAETTDAGLDWGMAPEYAARMPNYSHGTAGVAAALAVAGAELDRPDLVAAAVAGARQLLPIADLSDDGFELPMIIPPQEDRERVTYGWCHGPTGTSNLFAALEHAGVDDVDGHAPRDLRARCVRSVLRSGLPERVRPGFWDNDGRCCGTAGVGEMLLDAAQAAEDPAYADELVAAAVVMADAIADRAITDAAGTRWRFVQHRNDDPLLPPNTSWMQGSAGIAAFLLRLARVLDDGLGAPVVVAADRWWAVPAAVRVGVPR